MKEKKDKSITTFGDLEDLFLELRNSRLKKQGSPPETRRILVSGKPSKEIIIKLENNPPLEESNQRRRKKRKEKINEFIVLIFLFGFLFFKFGLFNFHIFS